MHGSCFAHCSDVRLPESRAASLCVIIFSLTVHCLQPDNCTRADIVTAISDNANWTDTVQLISLLNATYLLPDSSGPGTLLLPTNRAFQALRELT